MDTEKIRGKTDNKYEIEEMLNKKLGTDMNYRHSYIWPLVIGHAVLQASWFVGLYSVIFHAKLVTTIWAVWVGFWSLQGVALGAHRYYTHKAFKITKLVKICLFFLQTMAGQNSMFTWARDHRLHHTYSDTDADPHNSKRGFFFCHMGWLMTIKHPLVKKKQRELDISEFRADKMLMFQHKYFFYLYFVIAIVFPVSVPMYFWNETLWSSFFVGYCFWYVTSLHIIWSVNSFAHLWGTKPYDKRIQATLSNISWVLTFADGWHNFHHAFPWDYRMSEFGKLGGTTVFLIDFLANLGLIYDLKTVSSNVVYGHIKKYGDETGQQMLAEKKNPKTNKDIFAKLLD